MASLKFHQMELDFQFVKNNYIKPGFKQFVLQPFVPDANNNPDEFALQIYALDNKGAVLAKQDLAIDPSFAFLAIERVEFGNLPLSKKQAKFFIDADVPPGTIQSLTFKPYDFGDYIAYKVKANPELTVVLAEEDVKPSPPALPDES